ncbi:MAG: hypothetical protein JWR20_2859 [Marmoricola sp.]|nr:hypothetical protein [Marmoricola sp.]
MRRRRPSPRRAAGVVALAAVAAVAAGCGGSDDVEVRGTGVTGAERTACRELVAALPDRVADQARRTTSGSALGAAWGDPPIVLRCGVGTPARSGLTSQCQVANGLGWFVPVAGMNDQSTDVVMTTIERRPRVEVTLPARYRPPVAAMVDLGRAIKAHTRLVAPCG